MGLNYLKQKVKGMGTKKHFLMVINYQMLMVKGMVKGMGIMMVTRILMEKRLD